jgi:hypothetical protein
MSDVDVHYHYIVVSRKAVANQTSSQETADTMKNHAEIKASAAGKSGKNKPAAKQTTSQDTAATMKKSAAIKAAAARKAAKDKPAARKPVAAKKSLTCWTPTNQDSINLERRIQERKRKRHDFSPFPRCRWPDSSSTIV